MQPQIRPIALCLLSKGEQILVFEEPDATKGDCFCRPLGGGIEFGESSLEAVRREMLEELGQEVTDLTLVASLENIFTFNGRTGHEIVFIYDGKLADVSLYQQDTLDAFEHAVNVAFKAVWRSTTEIRALGMRLVPEGLEELLEKRTAP